MSGVSHWPFSLLDRFEDGKESSTFTRLGRSRHVADLRVIFNATVVVALLLVVIAALIGIFDDSLIDAAKLIGAILAVAGGIIAWAYQAGSKRLGVIDLIASEIVTLCRVTYLADAVPNLIKQHKELGKAPSASVSSRFNSKENYFTVYENNNSDLQVLEARALNNVAGFYTYMKAIRDSMRNLMELRSTSVPVDAQSYALINVIYMVFLAYESARNAINDLIEYEPTHAETAMIVLFTEMPAYDFLLGKFSADDIRQKRLDLRRNSYEAPISEIRDRILKNEKDKTWEKSLTMLPDLLREYDRLGFGIPLRPTSIAVEG
jgi:hypothetical protein